MTTPYPVGTTVLVHAGTRKEVRAMVMFRWGASSGRTDGGYKLAALDGKPISPRLYKHAELTAESEAA